MNASQVAVAVVVRTVVFAVLFLAVDLAFERTDPSTDALALGLLLIAAGLVVSAGWGLVDGVRRGFGAGVVLWLLASVVIGLVIGLLASRDVVVDPGTTDVAAGWLGAVLVVLPPALVGVALGGLVHRARRPG